MLNLFSKQFILRQQHICVLVYTRKLWSNSKLLIESQEKVESIFKIPESSGVHKDGNALLSQNKLFSLNYVLLFWEWKKMAIMRNNWIILVSLRCKNLRKPNNLNRIFLPFGKLGLAKGIQGEDYINPTS